MVHCMSELTTAARPTEARDGHRLAVVFVVTALGAFMASLDLSIVNVAFPALERTFRGDSQASLAWVITGYSIVFGSLLVVAGRTADRLGSRRVFFSGLAIFCLGSGLAGLAPTVPFLVAGRLVQGVGAAALLPSSSRRSGGAPPSSSIFRSAWWRGWWDAACCRR
jgi:MFS family permease